jgi:opacity protein-like surface antigen
METRMRCDPKIPLLLAIGACCASTAAFAENPAGFYIGAGVGVSTIRSDDPAYGYPGYYDDHHTAWKAIAGIRPITLLGLEYEYIDFGQPYDNHGYYDVNYYGTDSHPHASTLFAIGYLPIPIPFVDLYGKAGAGDLTTTLNEFAQQPCVPHGPCPNYVLVAQHDESHTKFAYGVGVQSKLPLGFAVRAEYERISSSYGDPDALTVSATWTF